MKLIYMKHHNDLIPVKVSDQDYTMLMNYRWWVHNSAFTGHRYACTLVKAEDGGKHKKLYMHRLITDAPKGMFVDHRDRDTLNNMRSNLRVCTGKFNAINRDTTNLTGFKGVYPSGMHRYRARIQVEDEDGNKRKKHLGTFDSKEEAARAYDAEAVRIYGDFAFVNFPPEEVKEDEIPWD